MFKEVISIDNTPVFGGYGTIKFNDGSGMYIFDTLGTRNQEFLRKQRIDEINAKYQARLDALNNSTTTLDQQKAEIERRKQEDFQNENESYRVIVGDEAFNDIVESGVVRTVFDRR